MIDLLLQLGILLGFALFLGEVASRLGASPLVGQVIAGLIVGPVLGWVVKSDFLGFFSYMGLILLVFLIGLETRVEEIKKDVYTGTALAASGILLTFIAGVLLGNLAFGSFDIGLAIGVAMLSTSTAVPMKILMDRKENHTQTGKIFVIMSLADDVIAILSLSLLVSYFSLGSISLKYVLTLFLAILGFIFFILTFGDKVINRFINFVQKSWDPEILFTIPLAIAFFIGIWSENIGMAAVTGVFISGIAMSRSYFRESIIHPKMKIFGYSLFIPIFFAYSPIFVDISTIFSLWYLIIVFLAVGIFSKAIGVGIAAKYFGFDKKAQTTLAISVIPRGEYGIVISQIALAAGIITNQIYTILIAFIVLTLLITPILFSIQKR